jgi:hypothetical protein
LHYFCVYLPHADDGFVNAFPAEPAEAFRDGHVAAFDFSGDNSLTGWMRSDSTASNRPSNPRWMLATVMGG